MTLSTDTTRTFIVRLWYEPREIEGAKPILRGWIESIATGERWQVKNVNEIAAVIETQLHETGGASGRR